MFDREINIAQLMALQMRQTLSADEEALLQDWLNADPANRILFEQLNTEESVREKMIVFEDTDRNTVWNKVLEGLAKSPGHQVPVYRLNVWPRIAAAAAIILILAAGLIYYSPKNDSRSKIVYANDIAPGKLGATLTLANGKRIRLADAANGELANEAGIVVTKNTHGQLTYEQKGNATENNQINTLSTAKGECYVLTLPDKSKVWLNAASSLTYTASLVDGGKRRVKLLGEAYFEISKDKLHPFVVESSGQEVEVLGTHFNVNSYDDEPASRTTLLEGSVKVSAFGTVKGQRPKAVNFLKPNQQASVANHSINIIETDAESAIAWKEGYFLFNDAGIETIMLELSRWYNIEVVYQGKMTKDGFNGKISRFRNISEVLRMLENTELVHFKVEGRRVIVLR